MLRRVLLRLGVGTAGAWLADGVVRDARSTTPHPHGTLPALPALGVFSVRAQGATGDGRTDDTPSIQAAIDAAGLAGGGCVALERGRYVHSGTLTVPANVHLFGFSGYRYDFSTRLAYTGRGTAIRLAGDHASITGVTIFTATGKTGVDTDGRIGLTVRDCNIQGFADEAVLCAGSFWMRLYRVHIQNSATGGDGVVATESFNQNVIDTCGFTCAHGQRWTAIDIGRGGALTSTGSSIVHTDFSGGWGDQPLIRVRAGTRGLWVAGNRMESCGASFLLQEEGAIGVTAIGNYIAGSTSLPAANGITLQGTDSVVLGNTFCDTTAGVRVGTRARGVAVRDNAFLPSVPLESRVLNASAGDDALGGYRSWLTGYVQARRVPAGQREVPLADAGGSLVGRPMTRAGSVTGIALNVRHPRTAGALTLRVQRSRDGGASFESVNGAAVVLGTGLRSAQATFPRGACPFRPGDLLRLSVTTSDAWMPVDNDLDAVLEVET